MLQGKTALVTGSTSGIGLGIALCLARQGANLILNGFGDAEGPQAEVRAAGSPKVGYQGADMSKPAEIEAMMAWAATEFGGVDILVNNAGGSRPRDAGNANQTDDEWWEEAFALNFTAARRVTDRLVPAMKAGGWGRIVNLTGAMTQPGVNAAGPAKAALWSWSRSLSAQLAPHGITVNCIAPGRISTPQIVGRLFPTEAARRAEIEQRIPMGRFGEPEELAALVAFLASEPAGYITGTQIPVDGGMFRMALP